MLYIRGDFSSLTEFWEPKSFRMQIWRSSKHELTTVPVRSGSLLLSDQETE